MSRMYLKTPVLGGLGRPKKPKDWKQALLEKKMPWEWPCHMEPDFQRIKK